MVSAVLLCALTQGNDTAADLRATLDAMEKEHFAGFLYAEKDGKEMFFHTVGYADREAKRSFSKETGIEVGSIVKSQVQVAVRKLADAGKLSLDDSITSHFKSVPKDKHEIKIRHLLNHTSGFRDVFGGDYEPMEREELIKKMLASQLLFKPGEKEEYSNCGYSMLATIVENVTGEGIEKHIARTQFEPHGIKRFGYVLPGWNPENTTVGYDGNGGRWGTPREKFWYKDGPSWNLRGNGGMIATIPDLAKWYRALHDGRLLKPQSYDEMMDWGQEALPDNALTVDAGGNGIFNTIVAYNPHRKLIVIAASTDARLVIEKKMRSLLSKVIKLAGESQNVRFGTLSASNER